MAGVGISSTLTTLSTAVDRGVHGFGNGDHLRIGSRQRTLPVLERPGHNDSATGAVPEAGPDGRRKLLRKISIVSKWPSGRRAELKSFAIVSPARSVTALTQWKGRPRAWARWATPAASISTSDDSRRSAKPRFSSAVAPRGRGSRPTGMDGDSGAALAVGRRWLIHKARRIGGSDAPPDWGYELVADDDVGDLRSSGRARRRNLC